MNGAIHYSSILLKNKLIQNAIDLIDLSDLPFVHIWYQLIGNQMRKSAHTQKYIQQGLINIQKHFIGEQIVNCVQCLKRSR